MKKWGCSCMDFLEEVHANLPEFNKFLSLNKCFESLYRHGAERLRITSVPDKYPVSTDFYEKPLSFSRLVHPFVMSSSA
jgi:hypothetical protein